MIWERLIIQLLPGPSPHGVRFRLKPVNKQMDGAISRVVIFTGTLPDLF
jgi:hypothetical protein